MLLLYFIWKNDGNFFMVEWEGCMNRECTCEKKRDNDGRL